MRYLVVFSFLVLVLACQKERLRPPNFNKVEINSDSVVFGIIGDYGQAGPAAKQVSELLKSWSPDFILTTGDNNYDEGALSTIQENIGQYYCDFIYNPDARKDLQCQGKAAAEKLNRFFPSLGNHDFYNSEKNIPYLNFFTLPGKETYYDFRWGSVHCFSINSGETGQANCCASEQAVWLKRSLANSDAAFKLVYFHHSPYSSSHHGNNKTMQWPFEEWGATMVVSGHNHVYERIQPKDSPDFHYFNNGVGGRTALHACHLNPIDTSLFEHYCLDFRYGAIRVKANSDEMELAFFTTEQESEPMDIYQISRK